MTKSRTDFERGDESWRAEEERGGYNLARFVERAFPLPHHLVGRGAATAFYHPGVIDSLLVGLV